MDRYQCRPELSERFGSHWSIMNFRGNSYGPMAPSPCFQGHSYGPMALKVREKFPPRLALFHGWVFPEILLSHREEHSMDQYRSRLKLSENFERHWSIRISGEIHMDQSLVHTFSWGNSYGPMVLKVLLKFPPALVLVHGWLFPVTNT